MYAGPGLGRRKTSTGPQTSSFSSTAVKFSPGLNWCCPVTQNNKRIGKLDAAKWSTPSCHRCKVCTGPDTTSLSCTADRSLPGLDCCCQVKQTHKQSRRPYAAIRSRPCSHRRTTSTGPQTSSLSGTAHRFSPGLGWCCPVLQNHERNGKLDAAIMSRPSCHRCQICTGPHTSSLSGTALKGLPNFGCCIPDTHVHR